MMKLNIRHIALLATVLLAFSCQKNPLPPTTGLPIVLSAHEAGTTPLNKGTFSATKALLDGESFKAVGNELMIYDYYTKGETSTVATGYYIDGATVQSTGSAWPFTNDERYEWTPDGIHQFFGWTVKDNTDPQSPITTESFFGSEPTFAGGLLSLPTVALNQDGPQFDFMYSNIEERNLNSDPYYGEVQLEFKHLFTAFKVTAADNSSNDVYLKNVKITGLKNKRSATINYNNDGPAVAYTFPDDTRKSDFTYNVSDEGQLLTSQSINVSPEDYQIMWPHTKDDFIGAEIVVDYKYKEPSSTSIIDGETVIPLKDMEWEPGQKHNVGLMFKDKEIVLDCKVEPWTMVADTIDFTDQISVSNPLTWVPNSVESVDYENGEVVLFSDKHSVAICNFHIDTPAGATWTASLIPLEGHSDAFVILDNTKYGAVGVDSEVHIQVTNMAPYAPKHVVKLRITVQTADGRTIIADMMPEQTDEAITEYKLIQNII